MSHLILLSGFIVSLLMVSYAYGEDPVEQQLEISIVGESVIILDETNRLIRAHIEVNPFNPSDGSYSLKVVQLSTQKVLSDKTILMREKTDELWVVDLIYVVDDHKLGEQKVGNYELFVYTEFGSSIARIEFSIVQSSLSEIQQESESTSETVSDSVEVSELVTDDSDEPKIPEWIKDVFIWYGQDLISEDELISALQFLIKEGILDVS